MCWKELNNHELQAMRKLMMLDVGEAAELIGGVSNRTWQYWESGRNKVPSDVNEKMYEIISQMNECTDGAAQEEMESCKWYHTFEDFLKDYPNSNKVWWKVHQAVCGYLFSSGIVDELLSDIAADKESYIYRFFSGTREEEDLEYQRQEEALKNDY